MKRIFCILAFVCPYLARPQAPLHPGNHVPAVYMQQLQQLAPTRPRLFILDFWATWCSSCIKNFPVMAGLQQQHGNALGIVLINSSSTADNAQKIAAFFKKYHATHPQLPAFKQLVNDSSFTALFPFTAIPHYVWISHTGRVLAITGSEALNNDNIEKALRGELLTTTDQSLLKPLKPGCSIFFEEQDKAALAQTISGRADTAHSPYLPGLVYYNGEGFQSITASAMPLTALYKRMLGNTPLQLNLLPDDAPLHTRVNAELLLPDTCSKAYARQAFVQLLNRSFGLDGRIVNIDTACWELQVADAAVFHSMQTTSQTPVAAKNGYVLFQNKPLSSLAAAISNSRWLSTQPIVVAAASITQPLNMSLPAAAFEGNITALQKALQPYGLGLVKARRPVPFLVLSYANPLP
ncbi:MAG: TlpA disulfide reductase family protein [Ferruginibacter sp.]